MNRVSFPLRLQMKRPEVADLHQALTLLGARITETEQTAQRYGASTRTAVANFQAARSLPVTGEVDEATATALNGALADQGALDLDPDLPTIPVPAGRSVAGTVRHADGSAIGSMVVQAFHRRLGGELRLGVEVVTTAQGRYGITYALPEGISKIDLFVRAFDQQAIVGVSPIVVGAGLQEILDLTVSDPKFRGPSEFARVAAALGPQLTGVTLDALNADDVALLVRNSGVGRQSVTAWIAANRLAARTGVDAESLYGLVRTENTGALPRLLRRSAERLRRSLSDAAGSNLISRSAGQRANATVTKLRQLAVSSSRSHETPGSFGRLLSTSTVASSAQQETFIERYGRHQGPVRQLWRALRTDPAFGDAVVDDLQLSLRLGMLTANHPPMVQAIRKTGLRHAAQTATLDTEGWRQLLRAEADGKPVGTPPGIKGATAVEREDNYITLLKERSARAFPTAHIAKSLKTLPAWQSSTAVRFLDANLGFNLLTSNVRTRLDGADIVMLPGWDRRQLEDELNTVQRVARVAPQGREETVVGTLLANGYASALAIGRQSRASFRRKTAEGFGDAALADAVHRAAQFQIARTANAYGVMHPFLAGGVVDAVGDVSAELETNPTWGSLFGNVDYCSCEHCRSIYSPAAYLVDLLAWLDAHDLGQRTAFERLSARRPDIQRIELSCQNTNTVLPYADLVTEILEVRVLNSLSDGTPATVPRATTATSPELLANPEYLKPQAYDDYLAKAVFPATLPFDLWGELGRVHFEHLGVRRSDLMEALRRGTVPADDAIDAERLHLSRAQQQILIGADERDVWAYWGYPSASPDGTDFKTDLAVVSTFLRRADIEYQYLLDLLHSRFVNPGGTVRIIGDSCNTDDLRVSGLTDDVLGRAHRFLRMWRNRGWSMLDLDKAFSALGNTTLDARALGRLADMDRIQARVRVPLLDVLSWWAPLDTRLDRPGKEEPVESLYDRVYLNRAVDAAADQPGFPLALNAARTALLNTVNWDDVRSIVQAALSIDEDDIALLLDEIVDGLPNPRRVVTGTTASLAGLSALYRHVSLARALKLTVHELLGLLPLIGIDPFDVANTRATVDCLETVERIRKSKFSLLELHYLLEHDPEAETSVGLTDEAIGQVLVEIRDGLTRVAADYPVVPDPLGEVTGRYLGVLLAPDAVAAVMSALGTEADAANHAELEAILTSNLGTFFDVHAAALIAVKVQRRFDALMALLVPYLQETQGNGVIIEKVASFAGRGLDSIQDLLALRLRMTVGGREVTGLAGLRKSPYTATTADEILPADDLEAFAALRRVYKAALVLNTLGVEADLQAWIFDVGVRHGLLNPVILPTVPQVVSSGTWAAWTRLVDLAALGSDLPGGEPSLVELLELLGRSDDPAIAEDAFLTELTVRTGWLREDVATLTAAFSPAFPRGWRDGVVLRRLTGAFVLIARLGVSAARADRWATRDLGAARAEELRLAAKSKHDEERWPAIARALRDPVREKQRAALVAYLIAAEEKYTDEADLYADLLIDVEMAPCMLTSRIKQAISSVQLFVQRALLNLEDGIELTRDDRAQWEWMKNYRVWEAARKVFLYPENWLEPDLRIDKTPLFEQLENALLQGEIDDPAAERAYTAYLEGLLKIARVEVMGLYHQLEDDKDGTVDVLHVVARTRARPHEYYYRQWVDGRKWTPWEALDVDIEGDHIILAVHDRRLFLFWPVVAQKAAGDEVGASMFEMKLAWIERLNQQWGSRRISTEPLIVDDDLISASANWEERAGDFFFRLGTGKDLVVECHMRLGLDQALRFGTFTIDSFTGAAVVARVSEDGHEMVAASDAMVKHMRFSALVKTLQDGSPYVPPSPVQIMAASHDAEGNATSAIDDLALTETLDRHWTYAYPHQYGEFSSQHGVFLDDDDRSFHVMPEGGFDYERFADKDGVLVSDVGTSDASSDVFERPEKDPPFDPALPWDKRQEPRITIEKGRAESRADRRAAAPSATAFEGVLTGAALADNLTTSSLRQTQSLLFDVADQSDTMTLPLTTRYRFSLFYHPYAGDFMAELRRSGVAGLLDPDPEGSAPRLVRQQKSLDFFANTYLPTSSVLNAPIQEIDFAVGGAYSQYNWEIFFHAPLLIASRLSRNQRFEEARRWFHFMFDPTNRTDDDDPLRFWKIKPFYREPDQPIEDFLALAASAEDSPEVEAARKQYDEQIAASLADPFDPHGIAELRTTAYQKTLVMKYLDNLIAWGDQLFGRDTIESIGEATQLYVLALELLGERPDALPPRTDPVATTFEQVRSDLAGSVLNNPLVQLENVIFPARRLSPTVLSPAVTAANAWANLFFPRPDTTGTPSPRAPGFYFCIPPNEKLLGYWTTIEDRLFKIRHCMNIQGVVRQLPLFEPPIDPGMLVRARAAGIDLSSALADLSAPLPHYRFTAMLQKAYALNQAVRALGNALLVALEKADVESLATLRANHEEAVLGALRQVKQLAIEEAGHSLAAAQRSLDVVLQRRDYYVNLKTSGVLPQEKSQVGLLVAAGALQAAASTTSLVGAALAPIPRVDVGTSGVSPTVKADIVDGAKLALATELTSGALALLGNAASAGASALGVTSSWQRRADEWENQCTLADKEITQIEKQIAAAEIRVAIAERDFDNTERQIENARSVREFMEQKFTNVELYQWMIGQLSSLYFQSYQQAYDLAKQAERAYRHELARPDATFIQFGYWDSLKKGLLAGERLEYDLGRMDAAFLDNNRREYEITRHVSLALVDPVALLQLRTAGSCQFSIPEALFDIDCPGLYLRRITSLSVTVPCITGPYTGVNMRLTLVASRVRVSPSAEGDYPMEVSGDDSRFQIETGSVESIVISTGRDDFGLFAADPRDDRYLPFERRGAISDWALSLTSAVPTFEWTTITDVILHLRYTAREGGDLLRQAAVASLETELHGIPLRRAFSAKSEFPSEWSAFLRPAEGSPQAVLSVALAAERFPQFAQHADVRIIGLEVVALVKEPGSWPSTVITVATGTDLQTPTLTSSSALYAGQPAASTSYAGAMPGTWMVSAPTAQLGAPLDWADDLVLIATYRLESLFN